MIHIKIAVAVVWGFIVLLPASYFDPGTGPVNESIKPGHGPVDYWTWSWLNPWYANTEDGRGLYAVLTDGTPYASTFPGWVPDWVIIYCWNARNNANNIKRPLRNDSWLPPEYKNEGAWPVTKGTQ